MASRSFWQHRVANRFFIAPQEGKRENAPAGAPQTSPAALLPITKESETRVGGTRPTLLPISGGGTAASTTTTPTPPASRSSRPESPAPDELCDRLRMTLVASQDAAVVQLLFEFCLPSPEEKVKFQWRLPRDFPIPLTLPLIIFFSSFPSSAFEFRGDGAARNPKHPVYFH